MTVEGRRAAAAWGAAGIALAASMAVALGFRPVGDFGVETDFYGAYAPRAARLLEGHVDPSGWGVTGPVYETALAAGGAFGVDLFLWGRLLSAFALAGSALLTWRIARRAVGPAVAAIAPWLLLLSPAFVRHGHLASTDALHLFFFLLALHLALRARTATHAALAGLAALGATLTRWASLPLLVLPLLLWRRRPERGRAAAFLAAYPGLLAAGIVALGAAGVDLPGPDFLHNADRVLADRETDWEAYQERDPARAPWSFLLEASPSTAARLVRSVPAHLGAVLLAGSGPALVAIAAVAAAAALAAAVRRRSPALHPSPRSALLAFGCILFLLLMPFPPSERWALPLVPLLAVAGASGAARLAGWRREARVGPLLLAALLGAGLFLNVRAQARAQAEVPACLPAFAGAASARGSSPQVVLARKPHLPWLLGARWARFPDVPDLAALRGRLARDGADHVFYGASEFALRPRFRFLAFPPYAPAGWEVVRDEPGCGVLYRVPPGSLDLPLPDDDDRVRALMNAAVSAVDPVPGARRLAAYFVETGRCGAARREYARIARFSPLTAEEEGALRRCVEGAAGGGSER